jgi:hypothetical protein
VARTSSRDNTPTSRSRSARCTTGTTGHHSRTSRRADSSKARTCQAWSPCRTWPIASQPEPMTSGWRRAIAPMRAPAAAPCNGLVQAGSAKRSGRPRGGRARPLRAEAGTDPRRGPAPRSPAAGGPPHPAAHAPPARGTVGRKRIRLRQTRPSRRPRARPHAWAARRARSGTARGRAWAPLPGRGARRAARTRPGPRASAARVINSASAPAFEPCATSASASSSRTSWRVATGLGASHEPWTACW